MLCCTFKNRLVSLENYILVHVMNHRTFFSWPKSLTNEWFMTIWHHTWLVMWQFPSKIVALEVQSHNFNRDNMATMQLWVVVSYHNVQTFQCQIFFHITFRCYVPPVGMENPTWHQIFAQLSKIQYGCRQINLGCQCCPNLWLKALVSFVGIFNKVKATGRSI